MTYKNLSPKRKKAISENANEWLKKNRVSLISNVRSETRELFDKVHEELKNEGKVKSREDTVIYLCAFYQQRKL